MRTAAWEGVLGLRLRRHHLLDRGPASGLVEVARAMCGVHAQMQPAAELALANHVEGLTPNAIQDALWERRSLVRIPGIRSTIHLLPAEDAPVWLAACRAGRDERAEQRRLAFLNLRADHQDAMVEAIAESIDGRALTLRELGDEVTGRLGEWAARGGISAFGGDWPIWRSALYVAGRAGLVCYGPKRGRDITYVRPDQWVPGWREVEPEVALAQAARWYLRAFGPATHADVARYLAIPPAVARRALEGLGGEIEAVSLDGWQRWVMTGEDLAGGSPASVRLLAHFDTYLLGSHPRARLFAAFLERGISIGGGGNLPALVVDGAVAGLWRRTMRRSRAEVVVEPFGPLTAGQHSELEAEVARLAAFTGVETTLALGPVEARAHL